MTKPYFWLFVGCAFVQIVSSFAPLKRPNHVLIPAAKFRGPQLVVLQATVSKNNGSISVDEIRAMRVKEIKAELTALGAPTNDVFEKEELVSRLVEARQKSSTNTSPSTSPASNTGVQAESKNTNDALEAPLYLTSLESGTRVAAVNGGGISISEGDYKPYPAIQIQVQDGAKEFQLTLLLDTACSGFVLRPSVVQKYNLPSLSTPVTMTGAGGVQQNTGLTQLNSFRFASETFGPLPAAVQDIGALPSDLDGIIGLSFLSQFSGAEMDFQKGSLKLYQKNQSLPPIPNGLKVVAEGPMSLVSRLGVYSVDVLLGGRGPAEMLVDTGASNTFLNWKGVGDLGLSRDSKFLNGLPSSMGAMGSDSVAMELTHRINISSNLKIGGSAEEGLSLSDGRRLSVDIGDIAILSPFPDVGGILGIDAMMRCDVVRFSFGGTPRMEMLEKNNTN